MQANNITNILEEDRNLLANLKTILNTPEGREFVCKMEFKMQFEPAMANDLLLSEFDNEDGLYLVRCYDHEFIIGCHLGNLYKEELYAMTFSEAMNANLKSCGLINDNITLIDWLKKCNFKNIRYNHNYDLM